MFVVDLRLLPRNALAFTDPCPSPKPKMRLKRRTCEEARNIVTKTGNYRMAGFSQSTQPQTKSSSCHRRISMRIGNSTRCHKCVILIVVNDGKSRPKGEQRRRKRFIGFSRNLLISFDYGQLRQVLIKLVVRLLTEGLLFESSPGSQILPPFKQLRRSIFAVLYSENQSVM